jgi:cardiolipin synthase
VLPIGYLLAQQQFKFALLLIFVAGISDALDGYLAKHYHWESRLGSFLDPLADKLLLLCCFGMCVWVGLIPWWLFVLILVRDTVVAAGAMCYHLLIEPFQGEPPFSSKLNTVVQIVFILAVIVAQAVVAIPASWLTNLMYVVVATTTLSGVEYVWVWGLRAWYKTRE